MIFVRVLILELLSLFILMLMLSPSHGRAAEFRKSHQLVKSAQTYLALRDVNVRAKPMNKSARVGSLRKNERVNALGKAKGTRWIAVKRGENNIGFVYDKALLPVIDGSLKSPIDGKINTSKKSHTKLWSCDYTIEFIGKIKVKNSLQVTSDYNLDMKCVYRKKIIKINATMFITELPYLGNKLPIFQINVDLDNVPIGSEDMFSTTVLYYERKNIIVYDRVNKEPLKSNKTILEKNVLGIDEILRGAVEIAHQSWGPIIWSELAKIDKN